MCDFLLNREEKGEIQALLYGNFSLPTMGENVHGCKVDHDKGETIFLNQIFGVLFELFSLKVISMTVR